MRASCRLTRLGSASSSKKMSRNSSRVSVNAKSSRPSPSLLACPRPAAPSPCSGRSTSSPAAKRSLPGCTCSRTPPRPCANWGSAMSRPGMPIFSPFSRSRIPRLDTASDTACRICALKRRMNRLRLTELRLRLSKRRSTMRSISASRRLPDPQVPLAEQPDLFLGVAAGDHPVHEVLVLLLVVGAGLGIERDDGQQFLGVREHLLLDHRAQLLVAGPRRALAVLRRARTQHEVDDLVPEVFRVRDAGRLLDLLELLVERAPVEDLAGVRVAELLVLD